MFIYILLSLLFFVFALLLWILLAPFTITLDSRRSLYEFRLQNIARVSFLPGEESLVLGIHTWIYEKELVYPWHKMFLSTSSGEEGNKTKKQRKRRFSFRKVGHKLSSVLQSFELNLRVNVDTSDCYYNAMFYPVFYFISSKRAQLNINYSGVNEFTLKLRNRLGKILFALIF